MNTTLLARDARNRALRTFLQGLGVDLLVAVITLLLPLVTTARAWSDFQWQIIGFSLAKTVVQTSFAYIMRRVVDGSPIPTPLPPEPVPEPNENVAAEYEPERELADDPQPRRAYEENPYGDQPGIRPDGSEYWPGRDG